MMNINKLSEYFIRYMLAILLFVSCFVFKTSDVSAKSEATTLAELRQELRELQAKKQKTQSQKAYTEAQKRQKNNDIKNANQEIVNSENKIIEAKASIEETNKKIEELNAQTNELMENYQLLLGDNSYLEFVTDSSSMTELIMRVDAVKQISQYNKNKLTEMEELIKTNEQKQVDLKNYEVQLNNNIASYEKQIENLDSSLLELEDISMDINEEIKIVETNIKNYVAMGCKENQKFTDCASYSYNSTWLKPVVKGTISSLYGWRTLNGKSSNHSGIDISIPEKTTVYSSTNGKVVYIIRGASCGGNQVYIESKVNGVTYTMLYAHLLSINVSMNQTVTNQTVIGSSGGKSTSVKYGGYDRCTFGAHLHYSVSKSNWTSWSHFYTNLMNPPGFPGKGATFYARTQWF